MPEGMMKTRKRLLANEPSPPSSYVDVVNAPWETSKFPGIEHKVLYNDPNTGMATLLFRLAPGAIVPLHEHTGVEMTYVLKAAWKMMKACARREILFGDRLATLTRRERRMGQ